MRTGEVFALTWDDIDFENRTINVDKTVYPKIGDINGRWFIGTTKTSGSSRTIYMCDTLYKVLLSYKKIQETNRKKYKQNYYNYYINQIKNKYGKLVEYQIIEGKRNSRNINLVFVKENGKYCGKDIIKYPYRIINHELNIKTRFYDLRGNFATVSLRNGAQIKDVSKVLGHSKIETTQNYYIKSQDDELRSVFNYFEKNQIK